MKYDWSDIAPFGTSLDNIKRLGEENRIEHSPGVDFALAWIDGRIKFLEQIDDDAASLVLGELYSLRFALHVLLGEVDIITDEDGE